MRNQYLHPFATPDGFGGEAGSRGGFGQRWRRGHDHKRGCIGKGNTVMKQAEGIELSRRAFLQAVGLAGGASILAACAPAAAPAADTGGEQVVNFLWTDAQNTHQPLI